MTIETGRMLLLQVNPVIRLESLQTAWRMLGCAPSALENHLFTRGTAVGIAPRGREEAEVWAHTQRELG